MNYQILSLAIHFQNDIKIHTYRFQKKSSYDLKELMKEHAKNGNTVFFSTHVLEVAEKLCDRVGIINKGKIVFVGTIDEIKKEFKDGSLEELFLEITE